MPPPPSPGIPGLCFTSYIGHTRPALAPCLPPLSSPLVSCPVLFPLSPLGLIQHNCPCLPPDAAARPHTVSSRAPTQQGKHDDGRRRRPCVATSLCPVGHRCQLGTPPRSCCSPLFTARLGHILHAHTPFCPVGHRRLLGTPLRLAPSSCCSPPFTARLGRLLHCPPGPPLPCPPQIPLHSRTPLVPSRTNSVIERFWFPPCFTPRSTPSHALPPHPLSPQT